jgi:DNA-binding CsgD family transcriptional regulator/tetratricopeptide (TPR) repeat protein
MELLERDQFISVLGELFEKVKTECGYVVSISGEAGIGKTSLVEFFTNKFKGQANILWGSCDDLFTPRPLAPLYDIANQIDSKIIDQLDSGVNRPSIFSNFFKEIQNSMPKIIVIEDMHWADESTLDLLRFLGRRINKTNALLLITYRDDEIKSDHPLKLTLSNLQSNYLKRIKLSPLSENAVNTLALKYGRTDSKLYQKTGGNPLLVSEVLSNGQSETPASVKELFLSKLKRLSSDRRTLVEMISVIPGRAEKWLVQKLVNDLSLIDEILEFGILKSEGDSFLFRHELARIAIEESLLESKRIEFNLKVLSVLTQRENTEQFFSRIIHHASKAFDKDSIIKYAPSAAKQASLLGAHREAVKIYQTVLHYSDLLSAQQKLDLLEGVSYECFLTGCVDEAVQASESAIKILQEYPAPEREGEIYRRLSRILWYDCQDEKGEEYLDRAIQIFENLPPSKNLAMAYSNKSQTYAIREDYEIAIDWGNKALELARRLNDKEVEAHALNNIGCCKMLISNGSGENDLLKSLEISVNNDFYEHATRAYANLGSIHLQQRNLLAADKYFERGLDYGNEKDIYVFSLCMAGHYAKTKLQFGLWNESIDLANYVLKEKSTPPGNTVMPLNVLAVIRMRRNDPGSLKLIDEATEMSFKMGEMEKIVSITAAKAELLWLQNKLETFAGGLYSIYLKVLKSNNVWAIGEMAYWVWKAGKLEEVPKQIAKPYLLQIQGNWREASELWNELHCPYEQALALSEGDEASMKKSIEIFERLGASAAVQLIKQMMRESGIKSIPKGPRQTTKANPSGLTKRELEVLKLVSRGLSNSDIAKDLFISPKTVDHHISAIFSKLNIHSRIEVAAYFQSNFVNQLN